MKKIVVFSALALVLFSCHNKEDIKRAESAEALAQSTREELLQAVSERDSVIAIMSEITTTANEIKQLEGIVSINAGSGENVTDAQTRSDLAAIKATLEQRRKRIEELEKQLRRSNTSNSQLLASIETLKAQVTSQAAQIDELTQKLSQAHAQIADLGQKVDSLSTQVTTVTSERDQAQEAAIQADNAANACFFAIGTKQDLKNHGIIEGGGFLQKTKIMQGDFDKSFFVQADKRTLTVIPIIGKKAKVITTYQPKGSYEIVNNNGQLELRILNPQEFWGVSNFLVIQVD